MMASCNRSQDVHTALQRARNKICGLEHELSVIWTDSEDDSWTPSKELKESLVDMYKANPRVNQELKHRLPSPQRSKSVSPEQRNSGNSPSFDLSDRNKVSLSSSAPPVLPEERIPSPVLPPAPPTACEVRQMFDQESNISFLLKELDSLRDLNKKLQEQLAQKEKELERRLLEEDLKEEQKKMQFWERPSAVLEQILLAQKERDQAMMSRVRLANEERDEALLRAARLQQATNGLEVITSEESGMGVQDLLRGVCEAGSANEVRRSGLVLLQRIQEVQQSRASITAQEMDALIQQRDLSLSQLRCLEQRQTAAANPLVADHTCQGELETLQRERDQALERSRRLEAELQALRSNQSPSRVQSSQSVPQQDLVLELQRSQRAEWEAREQLARLERLVDVLRKKVGTGSVRSVI